MKVLDRYLLRSFLGVFFGSLLAVAFLFTALSVLDSLSYMMGKKGVSFLGIVHYYALQLPQTIYMTAPVAALLSAMIVLGTMNQRFEILALRASGVSIFRAAVPMLIASAIIGAALFVLGNTLVPYGNRYFFSMKEAMSEDEDKPEGKTWYMSERPGQAPIILSIEKVNRRTGVIKLLTVFRVDPEFRLAEMAVAEQARWLPGQGWLLSTVERRTFSGYETPVLEKHESLLLEIPDTQEDLLRVQRAPEEMTLSQLNDQIQRVHRYGLPDAAFRVERQARYAIPLATVILVLFGSPLSIRPVRSSGLMVSMVAAVIVGFVYYVIMAEFISLGKGGLVSPVSAAWSANLIFGLIGSGLFFSLRK